MTRSTDDSLRCLITIATLALAPMLLASSCEKPPKPVADPTFYEGWLPLGGEPVWARYQIEGDHAVLDDMLFPLDYLDEFQASLPPEPIEEPGAGSAGTDPDEPDVELQGNFVADPGSRLGRWPGGVIPIDYG